MEGPNPYDVPEPLPAQSEEDSSIPIERAAVLYVFWLSLVAGAVSLVAILAYLAGGLG